MGIDFIGIKKLDDKERSNFVELVKNNYEKVKKKFKDLNLILNIKKKSIKGKRHRYEVDVKAEAPSVIAVVKRDGWEMRQLLHKVFGNLRDELEHKFKINSIKKRKKRLNE